MLEIPGHPSMTWTGLRPQAAFWEGIGAGDRSQTNAAPVKELGDLEAPFRDRDRINVAPIIARPRH